MSKKSSALARIRQLASLGLPSGLFVSSLLPTLRVLLGSHSAAFFWIDRRGCVSNYYAEEFPLPDRIPAFADAPLCQVDGDCMPRGTPAEGVIATSLGREVVTNGLYGEILRRSRAEHILHGFVRTPETLIGRLSLFRPGSSPPFGRRETSELSRVIRYVGHGLGAGAHAASEEEFVDTDDALDREFLVASRQGIVVHATEKARRLLVLSTGCALAPGAMTGAESTSRQMLRALCAPAAGTPALPPCGLVRDTVWGRFVLRAYALDDRSPARDALFGVHIRRQQPARLRFVNAMSTLPLSPQQQEIALMIATGGTNRDIAARLGVSMNTVAYHVKQLFRKLGVHDRWRLLSTIDGNGPVRPALARAATSAAGRMVRGFVRPAAGASPKISSEG